MDRRCSSSRTCHLKRTGSCDVCVSTVHTYEQQHVCSTMMLKHEHLGTEHVNIDRFHPPHLSRPGGIGNIRHFHQLHVRLFSPRFCTRMTNEGQVTMFSNALKSDMSCLQVWASLSVTPQPSSWSAAISARVQRWRTASACLGVGLAPLCWRQWCSCSSISTPGGGRCWSSVLLLQTCVCVVLCSGQSHCRILKRKRSQVKKRQLVR